MDGNPNISGMCGTLDLTADSRNDAVSTQVLNHLLFHKAIIDDEDDGMAQRLDNYLDLLDNIDMGMHHIIKNPVDKAIAIAFQLVMDRRYDPWDIDIGEFTKTYMKKIRKEKDIDFVIAGKLVFMAWSILRMQSDRVLKNATPPEKTELFCQGWDLTDFIDDGFYMDPADIDFTNTIINSDEPPIQEMIRRNSTRAVTLIELLDAFDEARRDAEKQMELNELRKKRYKEMRTNENFTKKMHKENLQEDISNTWLRICEHEEDEISLSHLVEKEDKEDLVTVFVSILFLAHMNKVRLKQRPLPNGEIMIRNLVPADKRMLVHHAETGVSKAAEKVPAVEIVTHKVEETHEKAVVEQVATA